MCKCTPSIRTPYCGKPGCEWPTPNSETPASHPDQWEILFNRWRSLGKEIADLGNIVQNSMPVPLRGHDIQEFHERTQTTEKAYFRLVDETFDLIEGKSFIGSEGRVERNSSLKGSRLISLRFLNLYFKVTNERK